MKNIFMCLLLSILVIFVIGCQKSTLIKPERPLKPKPIAYCHNGIGHISGNIPWILGGNCCCTPTKEMFAINSEEQTIPEGMTYDEYLQLYKDKGIITDLDEEYRNNNCRCELGPHVVFGGHCMITPTPGTLTYEEVTSGTQTVKKEKK